MIRELCSVNDFAINKSLGFVLETNDGRCGLILVRLKNQFFCYLNSCPHLGTPLEIRANQFLDSSGKYILCSTHGALFKIEDGYCVAGPCITKKLTRVKFEVREDIIWINTTNLPTLWPARPKPP